MTGNSVTIDLDTRALQAPFARFLAVASGTARSDLLADIGEAMLNSTRDRAAEQKGPDGTPWVPLSPRYAKRKAKQRPGRPILEFDRHLLGDMLSWQPDGEDAVLVGTNAIYGATHQFGRGGIPPRPFLGISADDEGELLAIVSEHLRAALAG